MQLHMITAGSRKAIALDGQLIGNTDDYADLDATTANAVLGGVLDGLQSRFETSPIYLTTEDDGRDWDEILEDLFPEPEEPPVRLRHRAMTEVEYATAGGSGSGVCPFCHDAEITGEDINIAGDFAHQDIYCGNCENEWTDRYALSGYATDAK